MTRPRAIRSALALLGVIALVLAGLRVASAIAFVRPLEGSGIVAGKRDADRGEGLILEGGQSLPVLAIGSRIDVGDRVVKRAGELSYDVNGARVSPLGTVVGGALFFWVFLPAIAVFPAVIFVRTREA